jgi:hypothetical protein
LPQAALPSTSRPQTSADAGGFAARFQRQHRGDVAAVAALCALVAVAEWQLLKDGTVIGMDTATGFYPWYSYLGEQLRAGHIPLWNPYQFAGTPFAADPESGWAYLPAMVWFTVLPLGAAANAFMAFHVLLAGLSTYALARSLGIPTVGAAVSAFAYSLSGFFFGHNICCFAYSSVAAWLPVGLLGVQGALHASTWRRRVCWWACGGLAVSQLVSAWVGQGAYYALLFLGTFLLYRTLTLTSAKTMVATLALHGAVLLGVGFGLAAIGLLPRLEFNAVSNLPGGYEVAGYPPFTAGLLDWGIIEDWRTRLLTPGFHYAGLVCLGLALLAPPLVRTRHAVPFFFFTSVSVLVVARWQATPLHVALSYLPGFGPMHMHAPERVLLVWFIGPALLAGATVGYIQKWARWGPVVALGLASLVVLDLRMSWVVQLADARQAIGAYQLEQVDMAQYYASTPAAEFLRSVSSSSQARSIGFAQHIFGGPLPYTLRWTDPKVSALDVNNRALMAGVSDVQGYNPLHIARLDNFMGVLNGQVQEYHQNDVLVTGLESPLLDVLGVRYLVLPATPAPDQLEPTFSRELPIVYADADVKVLENDRALPRVWIVHNAVQLDDAQALEQISAGAIDPRRTAALEQAPPPLAEPRSGSDLATILQYSPETIRVQVESAAAGLLILSDVVYPAWHARVDDTPSQIYVADGALRGVVVPAGKHTVEFEYASSALPNGAAITALTLLLLLAAAMV